jgi:hypothetical protein
VEAPKKTFRERRPSQKYSIYMALMCNIIDSEPSSFEEALERRVWQDAMMEENSSIMKNDVWDIVSRLERKSVVNSKWIYKINHAAYDSVEKYKARFVARCVEIYKYEQTQVSHRLRCETKTDGKNPRKNC